MNTRTRITEALDAIYREVARDKNRAAWIELEHDFQMRRYTRIELFDMIWWAHIHKAQPRAGG